MDVQALPMPVPICVFTNKENEHKGCEMKRLTWSQVWWEIHGQKVEKFWAG